MVDYLCHRLRNFFISFICLECELINYDVLLSEIISVFPRIVWKVSSLDFLRGQECLSGEVLWNIYKNILSNFFSSLSNNI